MRGVTPEMKRKGWRDPWDERKSRKWRREGTEGKEGTSHLRREVDKNEAKKEEKVKEQQERGQLQSVFCFHKMTTVYKSLKFGVH